MYSLIVLLATTGVSVDYGWQPNPQGEVEYIIQIEPELLQALANGDEITSRIDPRVEGVRRFRIRVGSEAPPRIGTTEPARPKSSDRQLDKVAGDAPGPVNASIPARRETDFDLGGPARIQPPPLTSPHRLDTDQGGAFHPESDGTGGGYFPLKPPIDSGNGVPAPIPDPDSESRRLLIPDSPAGLQPGKLQPSPNSGPLTGQQASYDEVVGNNKSSNLPSSSGAVVADEKTSKSWTTLVLVCLLLFASIGLNLYLGWIARGIYVRYRFVSGQVYENQAAAI